MQHGAVIGHARVSQRRKLDQMRQRLAVVMQPAIGIVLEQPGAGAMRRVDQRLAHGHADQLAGGVGEVRHRIGELRAGEEGQRIAIVAVEPQLAIGGHAGAPGIERAEISGKLAGDDAAFLQQHLADDIEPLDAAGGYQHVGAAELEGRRGIALGHDIPQFGQALDRSISQRVGRVCCDHPPGDLGDLGGGIDLRRRQAARQVDEIGDLSRGQEGAGDVVGRPQPAGKGGAGLGGFARVVGCVVHF